jgi:hypothetical protein
MHRVWIEAALNGPWSRAPQPGIPDTVEAIIAKGVACARAGAIHTHAYDGGGPQTFDWQVYARASSRVFARRWTFRFIRMPRFGSCAITAPNPPRQPNYVRRFRKLPEPDALKRRPKMLPERYSDKPVAHGPANFKTWFCSTGPTILSRF